MRVLLPCVALMLGFTTQGMGEDIYQARYQYQHSLVRGLSSDRVFVIGGQKEGRTPRPYKASPVAIRFGEAKNQSLPRKAPQIERSHQLEGDGAVKVHCLLDRVFFAFASALISATEELELLRAVEKLPQGTRLQVRGFTCDLGPQDVNDRLALDRAERVAGILRKQGFQVEVSARGKSTYLSLDQENRAQNRRAEIYLIPIDNSLEQDNN